MLLDNNKKKKKNKQKTKSKHSLKDCIEQFFNFSSQNIMHDRIILDVQLLVEKGHDAGGLR